MSDYSKSSKWRLVSNLGCQNWYQNYKMLGVYGFKAIEEYLEGLHKL